MKIISSSGVVVEGDATLAALKIAYRPASADGFYFHSARSGLLTGVAANGAVWTFVLAAGSAGGSFLTRLAVIDFLRIRGVITTPFTTAQEWALGAFHVTNATGGYTTNLTQFSAFSSTLRKWVSYPATAGLIQIATTAAMTGSTPFFDQSEFMSDAAWELAPAATVGHTSVCMEKDYTTGTDSPLILGPNEGIVVRNLVAMGAAGVMRVTVDVAWHEADPSEI